MKKIDKDNIYTYITKLTLIKIIVYLVLNLEIWFSIIFSFSGLVCVQCFWAMFLVNARKCCTIFFLTQFHPHIMLLRPTRDDCRSIYSKLLILHIIFSQQSHQVLCTFFRKCQTSNCCIIKQWPNESWGILDKVGVLLKDNFDSKNGPHLT